MPIDRIKRYLTSFLVSAPILYGCIFVVNWLSIDACSATFWPPKLECRADLYRY